MTWWRRPSRRSDIDRELAFHVDMEAERHARAGVPPDEARRLALLAFGGMERHGEATHDVHRARRLEALLRDIRHAARGLLRAPAYSALAVLTLALGIGAATAMYSVINGVLLRPLVYGDDARLYRLQEATTAGGGRTTSYPSFQDWEAQARTFDAMAYVRGDEFRLRGEDGAQRLLAGYVSEGFFRTVDTAPVLGRAFDPDESDVVVLSHDLWQRRFGGETTIIGSTVSTADGAYTVVGVMPRGFRLPAWADVWVPLRSIPADAAYALSRRDLRVDAEAWGLVAAGTTAETAEEDLGRVVATLADAYPEPGSDVWREASLIPVRDAVMGASGEPLRLAAGAVALLLLVVCVNVAGLQLARGLSRVREMAVRSALGAGRWQLARQLLMESLVVALVGGALGVVFAAFAVHFMALNLPTLLPRLDELTVSLPMLLFALGITVGVALLAGVIPALRSSAGALTPALREGSVGAGTSAGSVRLRGLLVVTQVALAVVLTVSSGLLLRSLWTLQQTDLGLEAQGTVALRVFPPAQYESEVAAAALYRELREAVRRVPGVSDVALSNHLPMAGGFMVTRVETGGPVPEDGPLAILRTVSPEYFRVMGSRRISGRVLEDADLTSGGALVVNRAMARRFFGDDAPVGRSVTIFHGAQGRDNFGEPMQVSIVGVVEDERFLGAEADAPPAVFVPWTSMVWGNISLVARTSVEPATLLPSLRRAIQQVDVDIPVAGPGRQSEWRPMTAFVAESLEQRRVVTVLLAGFAASALALVMLGLFGVVAYTVAARTREIGVRAALGAPRSAVAAMIGRQALLLAGSGVAIGLATSAAATRVLQAHLAGVSTVDPAVLAGTAVAFVLAAVLATAVPATRAMRIAPTEALRAD